MHKTLPVAEAIQVMGAEKTEFESPFKATCCGSIIGKGNAFYGVYGGGEENELVDECCTKCLKKMAYYVRHRYDDFEPSDFLK